MELGTFGAILRYAAEREAQAATFYAGTAPAGQEALWAELRRGAERRAQRLQDARRELISEMILESISGLDDAAYEVELAAGKSAQDLLERAQALEAATARFYRDAAAKMPVRDVARLFVRLAQESEARLGQLAPPAG